jgi:hypothetical protein
MNRFIVMAVVMLISTMSLAACASQEVAVSSAAAKKGPLGQDYENALPTLGQLVVGMFRLEGTGQAVNKAQAANLLPLWKAYRSLSANQSVSPLEMQGLAGQLQDSMTREQLDAIAAMRLTRDDMMALMQKQGLADVTAPQAGGQNPQQSATRQALRTSGGTGGGPGGPSGGGPMPGGGPGLMGAPGGQTSASQKNAAQQVQRGAAGAALPSALLDALIKLLESKV